MTQLYYDIFELIIDNIDPDDKGNYETIRNISATCKMFRELNEYNYAIARDNYDYECQTNRIKYNHVMRSLNGYDNFIKTMTPIFNTLEVEFQTEDRENLFLSINRQVMQKKDEIIFTIKELCDIANLQQNFTPNQIRALLSVA